MVTYPLNRGLAALRASQPARVGVAAAVIALALGLQLLFPVLPQLVLFLPAVLLASMIGGKWMGASAFVLTAGFAVRRYVAADGVLGGQEIVNLASFLAASLLSIAVVDRSERAMSRLMRERTRLQAALEAANAAVWELSPDGRLYWDENFYRLVGLDPSETPPATSTFLEMIHPEDRHRMTDARRLMNEGKDPARTDEYRLQRPNGETVWLENHRTRVRDGGDYFIGITQDVTRRKLAEERVQALLRESDHRAKNQFAVINAVARETSRTTRDPAAFEEAFGSRLKALARSHDLMIRGDLQGTTLRDLLHTHLEPFGGIERCTLAGPEVAISASAAQYLGMAFHELATNAVKYGALGASAGAVRVEWGVTDGATGREVTLTWTESGGPPVDGIESAGFGTKVLHQLVPAALGAKSTRKLERGGVVWTFVAPLASVSGIGASG